MPGRPLNKPLTPFNRYNPDTGRLQLLCPLQAAQGCMLKLNKPGSSELYEVIVPDGVRPGMCFTLTEEQRVLGVAKYYAEFAVSMERDCGANWSGIGAIRNMAAQAADAARRLPQHCPKGHVLKLVPPRGQLQSSCARCKALILRGPDERSIECPQCDRYHVCERCFVSLAELRATPLTPEDIEVRFLLRSAHRSEYLALSSSSGSSLTECGSTRTRRLPTRCTRHRRKHS